MRSMETCSLERAWIAFAPLVATVSGCCMIKEAFPPAQHILSMYFREFGHSATHLPQCARRHAHLANSCDAMRASTRAFGQPMHHNAHIGASILPNYQPQNCTLKWLLIILISNVARLPKWQKYPDDQPPLSNFTARTP